VAIEKKHWMIHTNIDPIIVDNTVRTYPFTLKRTKEIIIRKTP
jgi:hypothetical protein